MHEDADFSVDYIASRRQELPHADDIRPSSDCVDKSSSPDLSANIRHSKVVDVRIVAENLRDAADSRADISACIGMAVFMPCHRATLE
jgi:hypothetical protein